MRKRPVGAARKYYKSVTKSFLYLTGDPAAEIPTVLNGGEKVRHKYGGCETYRPERPAQPEIRESS